ncbi:MAG: AGE family epimerase/isomerase [Sedimentisphaerales bacterium]|jgi:mannobiose 2-epimerase
MDSNKMKEFELSVSKELYENIVPFWSKHCIDEKGGFIGRMTNDGIVDKNAPKGLVLNARILWTFSSLYCFDKKPEYAALADRAYDYLMKYFWDDKNEGAFWLLDSQGQPTDDKKRIYGQGFTIYGLSEYYRAFRKEQALEKAKILFNKMEQHTHDDKYGGYFETFDRDWQRAKKQNLSGGDVDAPKSMNSSLHILEALANLYDVWKDPLLEKRIEELIYIFTDHIIQPDRFYCQLYFDEQWRSIGNTISFGHDIETSWLLYMDAQTLNNPKLLEIVRPAMLRIAEVVYEYGMDDKKSSLFYEADSKGVTKFNKDWWVQAEAVVGFLNAYQLTGKQKYLDTALNVWGFIENNIVDKKNGEWFWRVDRDGKPNLQEFKVSEWKCPYHNSRACIEILKRLRQIHQS